MDEVNLVEETNEDLAGEEEVSALESALLDESELDEKPEPQTKAVKKLLGQFDDEEAAERAWNNLRRKHGEAVARLRELEAEQTKKQASELSDEERLEFLLDKINEIKSGKSDKESDDYLAHDEGSDIETFIFQACQFSDCGKVLNSVLLSEYQKWKQSVGKELSKNDMNDG